MIGNRKIKIVIYIILILGLLTILPLNANATIEYSYDFEASWGDWYADNGVWQVGTPTNPDWCHGQCAGTVLDGNYPPDTDSRLVSPVIVLPLVSGTEEIHLRFQNWFSYSSYDSGQVQVSVRDPVALTWGTWGNVGIAVVETSGWSLKDVDLTAYAGKTVRIAFFHYASPCCESTGWYIDDIVVVKKVPEFTGDFEAGWGDWGADRGVWQVGTPKVGVGPGGCYTGTQCAGTELNGNYGPSTDSRLVTPTVQLPIVSGLEEIHLRFQNWFSYSSYDSGQVQVSVWDPVALTWGVWCPSGTPIEGWCNAGLPVTSVSGGWSLKDVDLTAYAGKTVRIAFFHYASPCCESTGWYIDDIQLKRVGIHKLTVLKTGPGSGTVKSDPPGINCGNRSQPIISNPCNYF